MLVAITIIAVRTGLGESEAEALAFAVQERVESALFILCGHGVENLVFVHPGRRRSCPQLQSPRLKLEEFDCDIHV